jgi:F-type H+-transporting ATPase subunit gamma
MAAQLRVFRQRIRSAQTTKKITRAMELISASRIQKAQQRVRESVPYERAITRAVSAVAAHSNVAHILTTEPEKVDKAAVVIFSSDRGLAGAFNSQVIREALELETLLRSQGKDVEFYLIGRKAVGFFTFRKRESVRNWVGMTDQPEFSTAKEVGDELVERFTKGSADGGVDEIHIVYNHFVSMLVQTPRVVRLLPLELVEDVAPVESEEERLLLPLYEFEPDAETVLNALLPAYIQSRLYNAMLESAAAKHAATQKAMKAASDNADKLITTYTRLANNARQSEITQQISEIVGGADALASQ